MKTNDPIWVKGILKEQSGQSVLIEIESLGTAWFTPDRYTAMPSTTDHIIHYDNPMGCGKKSTNAPSRDVFKVTCNDCNNALRSR